MKHVMAEPYKEASDAPGMKFSSHKVDLTMLPAEVLESISVIFMYGEGKYERDNWKKVPKDEYLKAAMRHLMARQKGESFDKESHLDHLDHAIVCLMMLRYREIRDIDNPNFLDNYLGVMRQRLQELSDQFKENKSNFIKTN